MKKKGGGAKESNIYISENARPQVEAQLTCPGQ
jgi:hypothetical protein